MSPVEKIVAALEAHGCRPHRSGDGWQAHCPAHEDRRPSLSVSEGRDGTVLLRCHAGSCSGFQAIVSALGLQASDCFPPKADASKQARRIVDAYDYTDEQGHLLFQVVRYEPKGFAQRRPDGNGGWDWNLQGVRRVSYRLPAVLAAAAASDTIYIVEGEKDVEALERLQLVATCNPGGAGKWRDEYAQHLAGAGRVVVIADADEPGLTHAHAVAAPLAEGVADVRLIPDLGVKDPADYVALAQGDDQLAQARRLLGDIAERTPRWQPTAEPDSSSTEDAAAEQSASAGPFRIQVYSARELLLLLAAAVLGRDFIGWQGTGNLRALVLDLEQHLEDAQEQLALAGLGDNEHVDYAPIPEGLAIDKNSEHLAELERVVSAKPYDLVRCDPFYKLHAADSSDEQEARGLVRLFRRWVNEHGFALLIDTHTRKIPEGRRLITMDDLFGSSMFARDPETVLGLQMLSQGFSRLFVFKARGRRSELRTGQTIDLLFTDDGGYERKPDEPERDLRAELLELGADRVYRTLKEWKAKPGDTATDPSAENYIGLRGGIGASEDPTRKALLELQRERLFEYAEGAAAGRKSHSAKCWRLTATEGEGSPWQ